MSKQIHRSVLYNWVGLVIKIGIALVLLPYIVNTMGVDSYGEYVFLAAIFGYSGVLEIGLRAAILRYTGNLAGRGEYAALNQILGTVFGYYSIAALGIVLFGVLLYFAPPAWILPVGASSSFHLYAGVAALVAATTFFRIGWGGIVRASERYDLVNAIEVAGVLLRAALIVVLLGRGWGVLAVLAGDLFDNLWCTVVSRLVVRWIEPRIGLDFHRLPKDELREVLGYSGGAFVNSVAFQLRFRGPSVLVGSLLSTGAAGIFGIAIRLQSYVFQLGTAMNSPFRARATALAGSAGDAAVRDIVYEGTKYLTFVACTLCGLLFVYADALIVTWMGADFLETAKVLRILLVGLTAEISALMLGGALYATGRLRWMTITNLCEAASIIALSYFLSRSHGLTGVAWAVTGSLLTFKVLVQPVLLTKVLAIPMRDWIVRALWRPVLTFAVGIGPVLLLREAWAPTSLFAVLAHLVVGGLLQVAVAWFVLLGRGDQTKILRSVGLRPRVVSG